MIVSFGLTLSIEYVIKTQEFRVSRPSESLLVGTLRLRF